MKRGHPTACMAALSLLFLIGCDMESPGHMNSSSGSGSSSSTNSPNSTGPTLNDRLLTFAMKTSVENLAQFDCDATVATQSARPVRVEFGTISKDSSIGEYGRKIPAVRAAFKITCMNRTMGKNNDHYISTFTGLDSEFSMWRCIDTAHLKADSTGTLEEHTYLKGMPGYEMKFEDRCGFVVER